MDVDKVLEVANSLMFAKKGGGSVRLKLRF